MPKVTNSIITMNFTSPIKDISVGGVNVNNDYLIVLLNDGSVWCIGNNNYGQCGVDKNTTTNINNFTKLNIQNAIAVAAGCAHSLVLLNTGDVYSFGCNKFGQLGVGTTVDSYIPSICTGITNATAISASDHSLVLLKDGTVKSFGYNDYGQLGDNTNNQRDSAVNVPDIIDVQYIKALPINSIILTKTGDVYACGSNNNKQIDATEIKMYTKVIKMSIANPTSFCGGGYDTDKVFFFVLNDGSVKVAGKFQTTFQIANAKRIQSGPYHIIVMLNDDTVWSVGGDNSGTQGNNTTIGNSAPTKMIGSDNAKLISAGECTSFVLLKDGTLKYTGTLAGVTKLALTTIATSLVTDSPTVTRQSPHAYTFYNDRYNFSQWKTCLPYNVRSK